MSLLLLVSILSLTVERTRAQNTTSSPAVAFSQLTPSTNLTWTPCLGTFECALFDIPATTTPYKGMVLTNPGGPGDSAIDDLIQNGAYEASTVGSNYDFVAFEPRGIGYSTPATNCTFNITPIPGIQQRSLSRRSSQSTQLHGPYLGSTFWNDDYEGAIEVGQVCEDLTGGYTDAGPYMSTPYLVHDMISIVDAFASSPLSEGVEDPSLVNFWGFSYGTFVAQTFASMYPDRVGRFVIDGVVDPDDYRSGNLLTNLQFTDEAFSSYFVYCHLAGPTVCPYAAGSSAFDIFERFEQTVERLDVVTAEKEALEEIKQFAHNIAYEPILGFPDLAPILLFMDTASQNISMDSIQQLETLLGQNITIGIGGLEWLRAVACTDNGNTVYNYTLDELSYIKGIMEAQSYVGGEFWANLRVECSGWSIVGNGRYTGAFGGTTKTPMLFVSNTIDPATPFPNGIKGTKIFPGAEIVLIDGAGHTTLGPLNKCGNSKINAYFQNGTLPGDDNFCSLEQGPFN
ncbi:alpha/beta-hydrolase, partial [Mollisia scopiformis]